ncbi:trypsin-like peptidase domain-containing protein [Vibrio alginolyticus]|nr:trypsin-like peptidase domain-containing protein [Vibrio alginolyticus]
MSDDLSHLHAALVQVKSKLKGSGVWLNLGFTEHSYVLTATHNIDINNIDVYDSNNNLLHSEFVCSLDELDVSIIKVNSACDNKIELYVDEEKTDNVGSKCWILGYPKSLVKTSIHRSIEHQGTILNVEEKLFFRIDEILPNHSDKDNIEGFSGGPIFEVINGLVYLKGIITDSFDDGFNYQRILGTKIAKVIDLLPTLIKEEIKCKHTIDKIVEKSCDVLDEKIIQYILEGNFLDKLNYINLEELKNCKYFYLPDDQSKNTQHLSLLRNLESLKSYIHTRIISLIMDDELSDVLLNPTKFEAERIFTIHVTDFKEKHELVAKLIRQENSFEYSNAIVLIIYSNNDNDLTYLTKKRVSRVIANYAEGRIPALYDTSASIQERGRLRNFLEPIKKSHMKFSVINIKFLVEMIVSHIENEFYDEEYDKSLIKDEIIEVVKKYE